MLKCPLIVMHYGFQETSHRDYSHKEKNLQLLIMELWRFPLRDLDPPQSDIRNFSKVSLYFNLLINMLFGGSSWKFARISRKISWGYLKNLRDRILQHKPIFSILSAKMEILILPTNSSLQLIILHFLVIQLILHYKIKPLMNW